MLLIVHVSVSFARPMAITNYSFNFICVLGFSLIFHLTHAQQITFTITKYKYTHLCLLFNESHKDPGTDIGSIYVKWDHRG